MSKFRQKWVTVGTFPHGLDMVAIEHELQERGIPYLKLDDITIQIAPHLSQAIGGVRLQVAIKDVDRALDVLRGAGVAIEDGSSGSPLLESIDRLTRTWPFLSALSPGWRFMLLAAVAVIFAVGLVFWVTAPSLSEKLVAGEWCVRSLGYNGSAMEVGTRSAFRLVSEECPERLVFHANGNVHFPGIQSTMVRATWQLINGRVHVFSPDTLQHIYEGVIEVEVGDLRMVMRSASTVILAEPDRTIDEMFRRL